MCKVDLLVIISGERHGLAVHLFLRHAKADDTCQGEGSEQSFHSNGVSMSGAEVVCLWMCMCNVDLLIFISGKRHGLAVQLLVMPELMTTT